MALSDHGQKSPRGIALWACRRRRVSGEEPWPCETGPASPPQGKATTCRVGPPAHNSEEAVVDDEGGIGLVAWARTRREACDAISKVHVRHFLGGPCGQESCLVLLVPPSKATLPAGYRQLPGEPQLRMACGADLASALVQAASSWQAAETPAVLEAAAPISISGVVGSDIAPRLAKRLRRDGDEALRAGGGRASASSAAVGASALAAGGGHASASSSAFVPG